MKCETANIGSRPGFSLAEVLIAIAILSIALVMVGVSFPIGVMMTTNVAERSTAAVVADEAFAKMKLYGINRTSSAWTGGTMVVSKVAYTQQWIPYGSVSSLSIPDEEFSYPSTGDVNDRVYFWSAICRREMDIAGNPTGRVRVVVFVSRKTGVASQFPKYFTTDPVTDLKSYPRPILVFRDTNNDRVFGLPNGTTLVDNMVFTRAGTSGRFVGMVVKTTPADQAVQRPYLNPGCFILDDDTGELYRILERAETAPAGIWLDRDFTPVNTTNLGYKFWVVPPAVGASKNPCIAVYQRVLDFN
jgi:prepilin-type N-terminal cleavage/methylation domain-containing protein